MTPDQIKAAAIEAAAEAMWEQLQDRTTDADAKGAWSDADPDARDRFIAEATAAITAYERAMVRPLADASPIGDDRRPLQVLVQSNDGAWSIGVLWINGDGVPALWAPHSMEPGDFKRFRLLPDAPETKP